MVYTSLTEAPHNLKEGIDWLVALKGTDAEANVKGLGAAVYKFLANKPVGFTEVPALEEVKLISKEFLEQPELKDMWYVKDMLGKFNEPMDKDNTLYRWFGALAESDYENIIKVRGLTADAMVKNVSDVVDGCEKFLENIKAPDQYKSAYSSDATWDASCAEDPKACAVVLVGIAPMLFTGLRSLIDVTGVANRTTPAFRGEKNLGKLLKAVGYKEPECRAGMGNSDIRGAFNGVDRYILDKIYDLSGFWAFYGLNNSESVDAVEPVKPVTTADAVEALKYHTSKNGPHMIAGDNSGVNMGLLHAWNAKKSNKPPKTGNALRSNMYYPWLPTVSDLGNVIPI
ncbi:hypothetical protein, conserved [Babesia ovata]|uniref:Uncharacterized protein n=1 Tax=Babesia ovata TaxID=189622 RepID=A0A2H6K776_9APIC|nr:uncharacterized protein BOVATA_003500 [Babesia ovata]GBE58857.1 hypothetical protein, conserved [Babesia ovata]